MERKTPFQMNAVVDNTKNRTERVCLKCTNGIQQISQDAIQVTQISKCNTILKKSQIEIDKKILEFNNKEKRLKVGDGYQSFISNADNENCPIR